MADLARRHTTNAEILGAALDDLHPGWQHLLTAALPALRELVRAIDTITDQRATATSADRKPGGS